MSKLIEIKWNGEESTLIRPSWGAPKEEVKAGGSIVVEEAVAENAVNNYKAWEKVGVVGESKVPENKLMKKSPKKGKKAKAVVSKNEVETPESE